MENAIYDEKGNLISVSSSNDELTGYRAKNAKFLSSPKTYAVNTNLDYNEDNKLVNISTINQNIAFTRENDILKKVEVNDDIVFANNVAEDKIVQQFANGTQIIKKQLDVNKYSVSYGNLNEFLITVNDNDYPETITDTKTGMVTKYNFDSDGILISLENEYGNVVKSDAVMDNHLFGSQLITQYSNDCLRVSFGDNTNYHNIYKVENLSGLSAFTFDDKPIYSISLCDSLIGFDGYDNVFGSSEKYTFSNLGYLTSVTNKGSLIEKYAYDDYGKLIESFNQGVSNHYIYDDSGNLKSEISNSKTTMYQYDNDKNLNQLTAINGKSLEYDEIGNLLHFNEGRFSWDGGQLLKTSIIDGKSTEYYYGADKIRTRRVVGERSIEYQYFNGYLVASRDNFGTTLYFYDAEYHALGFVYNNEIYLYVKDPLGVIRGIVNGKMDPVVIYNYDDWGTPSIQYCSSKNILYANMILYKDYIYDFESNLYYLNSRYYSPEIRRFISQDNLEKVGETGTKDINYNLYSYCNNNPIMLSDQFGYEAITLTFSALFMVFACVIALVVVSFLVTKIIDEVVKTFKPYYYNISSTLTQTKNDFYDLVKKFKKEALLAFGEYVLSIWMWWVDNGKQEYHHIIARTSSKCSAARELFVVTYKYNINDEANMVWLKYRLHKHLHTNAYYSAVNAYTVLGNELGGKYMFLAHLAEIKGALSILNACLKF